MTLWRVLLLSLLLLLPISAHAQETEPTPEAPAPQIGVESSADADAAIARRITDIRNELDGYDQVTVSVASGVVTLGGEMLDTGTLARLEDLILRVDGVVAVQSEVTETTDIAERLNPAWDRLGARVEQLVALSPLLLVGVAVALIVGVLGWLLSRAALWDRIAPNAFIAEIYRMVIRAVFVLGGLVLALDILGATALLGTILGAAGIVGLALGFAVRDTVENFIASVMLSLRQPFAPNDLVEIEGDRGKVIRLTSRATILLSLDGNHIRIPNSTVFKGRIVNFTRNAERRFVFDIGVETDADLAAVRKMVTAKIAGLSFVLQRPPPLVWIETMNESGAILRVTGWIDQEKSNFYLARSEALRRVKDAIEASGVAIPDTTYRIRLDGMGAGLITETDSAASQTAPVKPRSKADTDAHDREGEEAIATTPEMEALEEMVDAERDDPAAPDLLDDGTRRE